MANVPFFFDGYSKVFFGSAASRTTALAEENPAARYQEIGGNLYESNGSAWNPISLAGASAFTERGGFRPSSYNADINMDGTAKTFAVPAGATKAMIYNKGTAAKGIRVAFGTSTLDAGNNLTLSGGAATTGVPIPARADDPANSRTILGVPTGMTHLAVANDTALDTQAVSVVFGT